MKETNVFRRVLLPIALAAAMTLSGCFSGEPGEAEMADALHKNAKFRQGIGFLLTANNLGRGSRANPDVDGLLKSGVVEKASCTAAKGAPGYVCDFRWGVRQPDGSVNYGQRIKGRFYKANDGWSMEEA